MPIVLQLHTPVQELLSSPLAVSHPRLMNDGHKNGGERSFAFAARPFSRKTGGPPNLSVVAAYTLIEQPDILNGLIERFPNSDHGSNSNTVSAVKGQAISQNDASTPARLMPCVSFYPSPFLVTHLSLLEHQ